MIPSIPIMLITAGVVIFLVGYIWGFRVGRDTVSYYQGWTDGYHTGVAAAKVEHKADS